MRRCVLAVACGLAMAMSGVAHGQDAAPPVMAGAEVKTLWACFKRVLTPVIDQLVTPERFKMVVDGACLTEEQAMLQAAEAHLRAMDQGYTQITDRTLADLRAANGRERAKLVSNYVVLYETAQSGQHGKR